MGIDPIFSIIILVISVVVHEVSHGYAALALGDPTARYAGRLTLNPLKHIDWFGSIIVPLILVFSGSGMIIGWAKPVPVNPYNLKKGKWGEGLVAAAGPASNFAIAILFGLVVRLAPVFNLPDSVRVIAGSIVLINIVLAVFNLAPVPPLDGSKILFSVLPERFYRFRELVERYGIFLALIFIIFLWKYITPLVVWLFLLITGLAA